MLNYFHAKKIKEARFASAFLDYLESSAHRKISAAELSRVFHITETTVRNCFLPYIKDGIVKIEHQGSDVFYCLRDA